MLKDKIIKAISKVTGIKDIHLESPEIEDHGDYATNVAMMLAKKEGKNPREVAEKLIQKLLKDKQSLRSTDRNSLTQFVSKIEVAGPGFINFWISEDYLEKNLDDVLKQKEKFGASSKYKNKKVVVEYSSPNIAKPFTIGHLRSTIIGDAVANIFEFLGATVYRDNHLGDWGTQFGKQIYALLHLGEGSLEKNIAKINKSEKPVKELVDLYVEFHKKAEKDKSLNEEGREWFKKLEDGDKQARELWQKCIDWSWKEFNQIYSQLGVKFTENKGRGYGESYFEEKMSPIVKMLENKGLLKEGKQGAKLFFFPKDKYPPAMILKSDGATLYHTRDLATDKFRKEKYDPDLVINEVGSEQELYFKQLFEMEHELGWYQPGQRHHLMHGLFRFKDKKMSTRKGDVVWLEDVINEAVKNAKKLGSRTNKLAQQVGIGALKWNDLKGIPRRDILFDWDELLNMQGNSGPYIQYTFARTQSVASKAKSIKKHDNTDEDTMYPEELVLLRTLPKFAEAIALAAQTYSPNIICNYLFDLAQKYNTFYNKHKIIGSQKEEFRLKLNQAVGIILKNGLHLLGIQAPEKM